MKLLDNTQIRQKITRLAYEILERNYAYSEIILAGINNNGTRLANLLKAELERVKSEVSIQLTTIRLSPANPISQPVELGVPAESIQGKCVIIVDDVANTGRTIFYALKPLLEVIPDKVEVAVLVDRKHKMFPIEVDYYGMTLATTLQENIDVRINETELEDTAVFLN
ncbi:MAG: phosphoribosyltransferase family protein [Bacteroidota bacterium]